MKKNIYIFFLGLAACLLYHSFTIKTASVEVELEVSQDSYFKIYWAKAGQPYSEKNMARAFVYRGCRSYTFLLTDLAPLERLRIDSHEYKGQARIKAIRIRQEGFAPIVLETVADFKALKPLSQIDDYHLDDTGISLVASGIDPSFELLPELEGAKKNWPAQLFELAVVFVLVVWFFYTCAPLLNRFRFVPVMLFGALVLILTMAALSKRNAHPDEYVHLAAVDYYQTNWLPTHVGDPDIRSTYSVYGFSRLNSHEVFYFIAGKFHRLMSVFTLDTTFSIRLFNVAMFGLIFLVTVKSMCARIVAVPFLITPQVWYIFSYCNSGAFGLFVTFIAACELVCSGSTYNRYLRTDSLFRIILSLLYLGLLLVCLFFLKKTYYPFILFTMMFVLMQILMMEDKAKRKQYFMRLFFVGCLALTIVSGRIGYNYYLDGLSRSEKLMAMQEETANREFKPSTLLDETAESIHLKEKGETVERILKQHQWLKGTFKSAFGVYGYGSVTGPNIYYNFVRWGAIALLVFFVFSVLRSGRGNSLLLVSALTLFMLLLGFSFRHSWIIDFQPQGRYLFVLIPMLGVVYVKAEECVDRAVLAAGVVVLYALSAYSFLFYALVRIPKAF